MNTKKVALLLVLVFCNLLQQTSAQALEPIASGSALSDVSQLMFDPKARQILAANDKALLRIDIESGAISEVADVDHPVAALAIAPIIGIAALATGDGTQLEIRSLGVNATDDVIALETDLRIGNMVFDQAAGVFAAGSSKDSGAVLIGADGGSVSRIELPGPVSALAGNGRGWVFATSSNTSEVYIIDSLNARTLGSFAVPDCDNPGFPIVDDVERRLYITCSNDSLVALDSDTGVILKRISMPADVVGMVMASTSGRNVRMLVATKANGVWATSGRITAATVDHTDIAVDDIRQIEGMTGDSIFLLHGNEISRIEGQH